jgi:nicotinamide-nucleotide amidase
MAEGVRRVLGADIGLSLTGVAGPDEQDGQPVGTLFVGIVGPGFGIVEQALLPGLREQMRQFAVITALSALRRQLLLRDPHAVP